jgi:hypothetical protein
MPDFDPLAFYRAFPPGGDNWLKRCLEALCAQYARSSAVAAEHGQKINEIKQ